jgi:hypothetical protein
MPIVLSDQQRDIEGYRGSSHLKKPDQPIQWTPELLEEFQKCSEDPIYFAENYMKVVHVDRGLETITLYSYQKEIITACWKERRVVAECARQSGKTTAVTAFVLWYIIFNDFKNVAILANKGDTAKEILSRIQLAYKFLPKWLQQGVVEWNKFSMVLENGSEVRAGTTTSDNIRGFSINFLYIDEAAFIEGWDEFFKSVYPTISSGKTTKLLLVSTVNGLNHFYTITSLARQGKNNYKLIAVTWQDVPGRDETWKNETLADINYDMDMFRQEYENEYLGSSGTLIAGSKLKQLVAQIPIRHDSEPAIKLYYPPQPNRQYALVVDVSRGKGLDYSAFTIIDITEMPYQQVLVFRDNTTPPAEYAEIINRFGKYYNTAPVLVEINDIGAQVADMLWDDFAYENLMFSESAGAKGKKISQSMKPNIDRGIRTTKTVKNVGCSMLKLLVEQDQLIINDEDTIYELKTFSKKGNSYEAEPGKHDDIVMCLVLFAWMSEQSFFKQITDIDTLMNLRERTEEEIEENLLPFGVIDIGARDERDVADALELSKMKDELWTLA